ncbi:hypothetical protein Tco_1300479 [Tanacetum coccineum]
MNEKGVDSSKSEVIKEESKEEVKEESKEEEKADKAEHFEEINQNVVIRINGQKRYFSTLMRVLSIFDREDLNAVYPYWISHSYAGRKEVSFEKESTDANAEVKVRVLKITVLWVLNSPCFRVSVGFSLHDQTVHALASPKANELTIPEQTATSKGTSNPLMAGSLPKTTKPLVDCCLEKDVAVLLRRQSCC